MNQNKPQYHKEMEKIIESFHGERKRLLLHSCCAPCSSGVLSSLREVFDLTIYFYNPNLSEAEEYRRRADEQKRLIEALNQERPEFGIRIIEESYHPEEFYQVTKGLEKCSEGGERCHRCYDLRLEASARKAKEGGYDFFTTTLTISPMKDAAKLNEIGKRLEQEYEVAFLPSDFKKKDGYKKSIEMSREHNLYRQNFCGCIYSKVESLSKAEKI